jgi:ubiquinone/menaquinone biosynthesis C-methylase UbiE
MDRKTYMRDVYSKYWITAREKRYGVSFYDDLMCNYINETLPKNQRILEAAIGTGIPFSDFLQKKEHNIYGIDIAPRLVDKCRELNESIKCSVGDVESMEFEDNFFDCVFCFHSTWYFPNIYIAIDEMIRVAKPNGLVIFDIQNADNFYVNKAHNRRVFRSKGSGIFIQFIFNIAKFLLQRGALNWRGIIHEVPSYPQEISAHLEENVESIEWFIMSDSSKLEICDDFSKLKNYEKITFVVRK